MVCRCGNATAAKCVDLENKSCCRDCASCRFLIAGIRCQNEVKTRTGGYCKAHNKIVCNFRDDSGKQCTSIPKSGHTGRCYLHSEKRCDFRDDSGKQCTSVPALGHISRCCLHSEKRQELLQEFLAQMPFISEDMEENTRILFEFTDNALSNEEARCYAFFAGPMRHDQELASNKGKLATIMSDLGYSRFEFRHKMVSFKSEVPYVNQDEYDRAKRNHVKLLPCARVSGLELERAMTIMYSNLSNIVLGGGGAHPKFVESLSYSTVTVLVANPVASSSNTAIPVTSSSNIIGNKRRADDTKITDFFQR